MIRKIVVFIILLFSITPLYAQEKRDAEITFFSKKYDLGEISPNKVYLLKFGYKNTGDKPLVIQKVSVSCGCVNPEWSNVPLMPGQKAILNVYFNPKTKIGSTLNSVYIESNAGNELEVIRVKAFVKR